MVVVVIIVTAVSVASDAVMAMVVAVIVTAVSVATASPCCQCRCSGSIGGCCHRLPPCRASDVMLAMLLLWSHWRHWWSLASLSWLCRGAPRHHRALCTSGTFLITCQCGASTSSTPAPPPLPPSSTALHGPTVHPTVVRATTTPTGDGAPSLSPTGLPTAPPAPPPPSTPDAAAAMVLHISQFFPPADVMAPQFTPDQWQSLMATGHAYFTSRLCDACYMDGSPPSHWLRVARLVCAYAVSTCIRRGRPHVPSPGGSYPHHLSTLICSGCSRCPAAAVGCLPRIPPVRGPS